MNGFGAKTITKYGTTVLAANDLTTAMIAQVIYDGTEWQLQNPQNLNPASSSGAVALFNNMTLAGQINKYGVTNTAGQGVVPIYYTPVTSSHAPLGAATMGNFCCATHMYRASFAVTQANAGTGCTGAGSVGVGRGQGSSNGDYSLGVRLGRADSWNSLVR